MKNHQHQPVKRLKKKSQDYSEGSEPNTAGDAAMYFAQCSHCEPALVDEESSTSAGEPTKKKSQDYAEGCEPASVDESSTSADESIKRKSQDHAEGSEPNTASAATKYSKRMKMDSASQNSESESSTSPEVGSDSWTTLSTDPEVLVSDLSGEDEEYINDDYGDDSYDSDDDIDYEGFNNMSRVVNSFLCNGRPDDEAELCVPDKEQWAYRFATDRKENELSKLLKVEIDSLPIPNPLKLYLNYNRID